MVVDKVTIFFFFRFVLLQYVTIVKKDMVII